MTALMNSIPYKIAVLVYVYNHAGQVLLLHRLRPPNQGLYSPIGGKLEQGIGESPYACALREIHEEIEVKLELADIRMIGIVSERGFEGGTGGMGMHWLMFCFEVVRPLNFAGREMNEGRLEWVDAGKVKDLQIPKTDRDVIWPLVEKNSWGLHPEKRQQEGFFSVHIDCRDAEDFDVVYEHPRG